MLKIHPKAPATIVSIIKSFDKVSNLSSAMIVEIGQINHKYNTTDPDVAYVSITCPTCGRLVEANKLAATDAHKNQVAFWNKAVTGSKGHINDSIHDRMQNNEDKGKQLTHDLIKNGYVTIILGKEKGTGLEPVDVMRDALIAALPKGTIIYENTKYNKDSGRLNKETWIKSSIDGINIADLCLAAIYLSEKEAPIKPNKRGVTKYHGTIGQESSSGINHTQIRLGTAYCMGRLIKITYNARRNPEKIKQIIGIAKIKTA